MKSYNIITVDNGKRFCYRVYGNRYGRNLEVLGNLDTVTSTRIIKSFGFWGFNPKTEAIKLYLQLKEEK